MDHYFTDTPPKTHNRKVILFRFLGVEVKLISDSGTFSKDHVDEGTKQLIETAYQDGLSGKVLDLGCGYGVVAITLKKLDPSLELVGIDINSNAVALATENAKANQLDIKFIHGDGIVTNEVYHHVLINPPIRAGKHIIYRLFVEAKKHLDQDGNLVVVMRKQHGAPSAIRFLEEHFETVTILERNKGFWVFKAETPKIDIL